MGKEKTRKKIEKIIEIPEDVELTVDDGVVKVKGPKGENQRNLYHPQIEIRKEENKVIIQPNVKKPTKKHKMMTGTIAAHIKNLIRGVKQEFVYKLKICSSHFPMNVSVSNNQIIIKNFIGEKVPRTTELIDGVNVKIDGDIIIITSIDKEKAGNMATRIEKLTRRPGFDPRVFQDGIYIIEKDGKPVMR